MAIPNRPCKLAAISWRFRGDLSPQNRRDFEYVRILGRFIGDFFQFESNKNLLWCSPECSLSQTWRRLLVTRPHKNSPKNEKAQVVNRTVNVVISRCCFAEDGTCSTLIFPPSTNQILICGVIAAICLRRC